MRPISRQKRLFWLKIVLARRTLLFIHILLGCSSAMSFLSGRLGNPGAGAENVANKTTGGEIANQPTPAGTVASSNDEKELPTIEVAGVNLTSECVDLQLSGKNSDSKVLRCEIKTDSDSESSMKVGRFTLKNLRSNNIVSASGVAGVKAAPPETWRVSRKLSIDVEFDVPVLEIQEMRSLPASLILENVVLNGAPVVEPVVFKPLARDFSIPDPLCGSGVASIDFQSTFRRQTGETLDGTDFTSEVNIPAAKTALGNATICSVEFLNNIVLDFDGITVSEYRFEMTLGGVDNLLLTNIENVETIFGFPAIFNMGKIKNLPTRTSPNTELKYGADLTQLRSQIGGVKQWCAFGVQDCFLTDPGNPSRLTINLMNLPSSYLVKFARSFLGLDVAGSPLTLQLQKVPQNISGRVAVLSADQVLDIRVTYVPAL
ncbi:MAG: hypothetical protein ACO3A4_08525 [Silvanigrellaceae bacterium]